MGHFADDGQLDEEECRSGKDKVVVWWPVMACVLGQVREREYLQAVAGLHWSSLPRPVMWKTRTLAQASMTTTIQLTLRI